MNALYAANRRRETEWAFYGCSESPKPVKIHAVGTQM